MMYVRLASVAADITHRTVSEEKKDTMYKLVKYHKALTPVANPRPQKKVMVVTLPQ